LATKSGLPKQGETVEREEAEVRGNKITHKTKTGEERRGEERGGQLTRACFLGVNFITQHGVKDF